MCVVGGRRVIAPPVSARDAVHAGGTGELHAGGPLGCLPRKLNILGTAALPASCHRAQCTATLWRHSGTLAQVSALGLPATGQLTGHR